MLNLAQDILLFLFGKPHEALYTAATLTAVNFVIYFFYKHVPPKTKRELLAQFIEKILAYAAFLIIATRLDSLLVANMVEWESPTNFVVCMYILGREAKAALAYIRSKGIDIPGVLETRVENIQNIGNGGKAAGTQEEITDPSELDSKIQELKQQLERAEALRQNNPVIEVEDNKGGEGQ